jgi:hypothetical protein
MFGAMAFEFANQFSKIIFRHILFGQYVLNGFAKRFREKRADHPCATLDIVAQFVNRSGEGLYPPGIECLLELVDFSPVRIGQARRSASSSKMFVLFTGAIERLLLRWSGLSCRYEHEIL